MAYQLHASNRQFAFRDFARTRSRVAFLDELLAGEFAHKVVLHLDDEAPVTERPVRRLLGNLSRDTHIYTCGPTGFLNHVLETAKALDWPADQVHFETFAPVGPPSGDSFEVQIQSTGAKVMVGANETVVAAVARLGIEIPVSCEQGICGTCITGVVEGLPDHRDQYLTDEERAANNKFTPCCSRSKTARLVLAC
jgi:vanillate O-demethylase ferredoxin subunit